MLSPFCYVGKFSIYERKVKICSNAIIYLYWFSFFIIIIIIIAVIIIIFHSLQLRIWVWHLYVFYAHWQYNIYNHSIYIWREQNYFTHVNLVTIPAAIRKLLEWYTELPQTEETRADDVEDDDDELMTKTRTKCSGNRFSSCPFEYYKRILYERKMLEQKIIQNYEIVQHKDVNR